MFQSLTLKRLISLTIVALLLFSLGSSLYSFLTSPFVVTVNAQGDVDAPAEKALLTFSVSGDGQTPQVALTDLNTQVQSIKTSLIEFGVLESDMTLSQTRLVPANLVIPNAEGYRAVSAISITSTKVNELPTLMSLLYSKNVGLVSQPVLQVSDSKKYEEEAFQKAMDTANSKARVIARQNWKFVKKIVSINQNTTPGTSTVGQSDTTTDPTQPTAINSFKVTSVVSVTYRMW